MSKPKISDCSGCRDNFYNGNNGLGVVRCLSFETATMERKKDVPVNRQPPFKSIPLTTKPSCYRAKGYVRVHPDQLTKEGYWK